MADQNTPFRQPVEPKTSLSQSTEPDAPVTQPDEPDTRSKLPPNKPRLAYWFWGAIVLMAALSIALSLMAVQRQRVVAAPPSTASAPNGEATAAELKNRLDSANRAALEAVRSQIPALLDEAYKPAYAAIPIYAEYHYSVWGEYAELTAAALGDVGSKLQEMLFDNLDTRLEHVWNKLDSSFNSEFQAAVREDLGAGAKTEIALGDLTRTAIDDAQVRMLATAPVGAAAAISTGVAIKTAANAMAKTIAKKMALKASAKVGGKWVAAGTGAATAATACSWSGPGAALCAAAGGVGAWLVTDYGIVKLDEFWNRDEFEADLRAMVDAQKAAQREGLERAITSRALAVQQLSGEIVQAHDFTLRELSGGGRADVCAIVHSLKAQYEPLRENLSARTPKALDELRAAAMQHRGNLSLDRLVTEITANLSSAAFARVTHGQVIANLPPDARADRDVSVRPVIDGIPQAIIRTASSEAEGFSVTFDSKAVIAIRQPVRFYIAIEQHLRVMRHRYFGAYTVLDVKDILAETKGLLHIVTLGTPIAQDESASAIEGVSVYGQGEPQLILRIQISAEPLKELRSAPICK